MKINFHADTVGALDSLAWVGHFNEYAQLAFF